MSKDLFNCSFGELVVLRKSNKRRADGSIFWICLCSCGRIVRRTSSDLIKLGVASCGRCNFIYDQNQYIEKDTYIIGLTTRGEEFFFDTLDFNQIILHTWYNDGGYICSWTAGRLHNFIMNPPIGFRVDHKDGNPLNNRRLNLRICTHQQNLMNQRIHRDNKSGYKGVCKHGELWQATLTHNHTTHYLGRFINIVDAAEAYNKKAIELFGEFAKLNDLGGM